MRVLVLDPGERVGWATATITLAAVGDNTEPWVEVKAHGITALKEMALAVYQKVVVEGRYDVVVVEDWRLSAKHAKRLIGSDMQSSQFLGMVRLCCWVANVEIVVQQPAAQYHSERSLLTHRAAADIRARLDKLPKSHDESHDGSALRHLWHFFFKRYV